jgi:hypothetical protein
VSHPTHPMIDPQPARTLADDLQLLDQHAEQVLARLTTHLETEAERGIKAWLLATTIHVYQALMAGESVPVSELRLAAIERYGRRT